MIAAEPPFLSLTHLYITIHFQRIDWEIMDTERWMVGRELVSCPFLSLNSEVARWCDVGKEWEGK